MNTSQDVQKVDGRSKAARAAKRAAAMQRMPELGHVSWVAQPHTKPGPFDQPKVQEAVFAVEREQAIRNSVRRKLLGGSVVVNAVDLEQCQSRLSSARATLSGLACDHPLIVASQVLAD